MQTEWVITGYLHEINLLKYCSSSVCYVYKVYGWNHLE